MKFPEIPQKSILGINYSGMHDTAIAIVSPDGKPIFAVSLERVSRVKQDGRLPTALLNEIPWDRIATAAISAPETFVPQEHFKSETHPTLLPAPREYPLVHEEKFHAFLSSIPVEKKFVGHEMAHATVAFYGSGFDEAVCMTYDGGMSNDPWFGGLYRCSIQNAIHPLDQFSAMHYAKITSLYTVVTALLGFSPNKHEGKITGLAAYGKPTEACRSLLMRWFEKDYYALETAMRWLFSYDEINVPALVPNNAAMQVFKQQVEKANISREVLAATVQDISAEHVIRILQNAKHADMLQKNICLSCGLFSNVKINQRVAELGFEQVYVAPAMTDDGTALGAAWSVLASTKENFKPGYARSMLLGPSYDANETQSMLIKKNICFTTPESPEKEIAGLLARGKIVAVFQGGCEFGPRALGNRSILAAATDANVNQRLNEKLNRTEFMPFAPMTLEEDALQYYENISSVKKSIAFMTMAVNCTEKMKKESPAVVHIDGTARPQLITYEDHPFIYSILKHYKLKTGFSSIVNTSFNIHEEPIVCTPEDALKGFFISGLDYLYLEGAGLIAFEENQSAAIDYLQARVREPSQKENQYRARCNLYEKEIFALTKESERKEEIILGLTGDHSIAKKLLKDYGRRMLGRVKKTFM